MKTDMELRQEISHAEKVVRHLRKQLRERKRKAHGEPKRRKGSYSRNGHEYIDGPEAHFARRIEIYEAAGGEVAVFEDVVEDLKPGMCQGCAETHEVGWYEGEWHHNVKTLGGKRCDCVACGLWVCPAWHKRYHDRVIGVRQAGAVPALESSKKAADLV